MTIKLNIQKKVNQSEFEFAVSKDEDPTDLIFQSKNSFVLDDGKYFGFWKKKGCTIIHRSFIIIYENYFSQVKYKVFKDCKDCIQNKLCKSN